MDLRVSRSCGSSEEGIAGSSLAEEKLALAKCQRGRVLISADLLLLLLEDCWGNVRVEATDVALEKWQINTEK